MQEKSRKVPHSFRIPEGRVMVTLEKAKTPVLEAPEEVGICRK